jgi:hypothetical protein
VPTPTAAVPTRVSHGFGSRVRFAEPRRAPARSSGGGRGTAIPAISRQLECGTRPREGRRLRTNSRGCKTTVTSLLLRLYDFSEGLGARVFSSLGELSAGAHERMTTPSTVEGAWLHDLVARFQQSVAATSRVGALRPHRSSSSRPVAGRSGPVTAARLGPRRRVVATESPLLVTVSATPFRAGSDRRRGPRRGRVARSARVRSRRRHPRPEPRRRRSGQGRRLRRSTRRVVPAW